MVANRKKLSISCPRDYGAEGLYAARLALYGDPEYNYARLVSQFWTKEIKIEQGMCGRFLFKKEAALAVPEFSKHGDFWRSCQLSKVSALE